MTDEQFWTWAAQEWKLNKTPQELVDLLIAGYEVGACKPDKRIFEALVKKAGVPAESIVFADDHAENLAGAHEVEITTFVCAGFDLFVKTLEELGVRP